MKMIRTIGIALVVLGMGYAGFWALAAHDGKQMSCSYGHLSPTKDQLDSGYPFLSLAFRCLHYDPFDPGTPSGPRVFFEDLPPLRILRQMWCGLALIGLGGVFVTYRLRAKGTMALHYVCVAFTGGAFFLFMSRYLIRTYW